MREPRGAGQLTNRPETPGDIVAAALSLSPAERTSADKQLLEWHHEAAGYKVRYVPATLPDILKTKRMLDWEYAPSILSVLIFL
jgi:hypothetical protein